MKEFRVRVSVSNNLLKERREELGFTQKQIGEALGIAQTAYGAYECLRAHPLKPNGEIKKIARDIMNFFDANFDELWPPQVLCVKNGFAEKTIDAAEIPILMESVYDPKPLPAHDPEQALIQERMEEGLVLALSTLTKRERGILEDSYGLNGKSVKTSQDIGDSQNVGRGRITEIHRKALRKLRHPRSTKHMQESRELFNDENPESRKRREEIRQQFEQWEKEDNEKEENQT